jgi:hypothetical protein
LGWLDAGQADHSQERLWLTLCENTCQNRTSQTGHLDLSPSFYNKIGKMEIRPEFLSPLRLPVPPSRLKAKSLIFQSSLLLNHEGIGGALIAAMFWFVLLFHYRHYFSGIFTAKASSAS